MFCLFRTENHGEGPGVLTKITKYKKEGKNHATVRHYRRRIRGALLSLTRSVILCNTPEHVDAAAALAQVISSTGMNNRNYLLFLTLLETNNPSVIDILIGRRNPFLLFSPIKPNWFLIKETFRILATYKGNELYDKALLALLGVVQNAYKTSKDGNTIYPLRMSDVYNIGKYLDKERDQLDPRNRLLLEILYDIYFVGIDSEKRGTKQIGIKANDIRMAFFDNTKRMLDAIPDVLLVKDYVREPIGPKSFRWERTEPEPRALEAREAPELKVGLRERALAGAPPRDGAPSLPPRTQPAAAPPRPQRAGSRPPAPRSARKAAAAPRGTKTEGARGAPRAAKKASPGRSTPQRRK
jgi:hypothetical protein